MTDSDLMDALRDCYAPGTRRNIVAAGLVRSATLALDADAPGAAVPGVPARYAAHVTLYAPGTDDAANAQLAAQIKNRLLGLAAVSRVHLSWLPPLFPML